MPPHRAFLTSINGDDYRLKEAKERAARRAGERAASKIKHARRAANHATNDLPIVCLPMDLNDEAAVALTDFLYVSPKRSSDITPDSSCATRTNTARHRPTALGGQSDHRPAVLNFRPQQGAPRNHRRREIVLENRASPPKSRGSMSPPPTQAVERTQGHSVPSVRHANPSRILPCDRLRAQRAEEAAVLVLSRSTLVRNGSYAVDGYVLITSDFSCSVHLSRLALEFIGVASVRVLCWTLLHGVNPARDRNRVFPQPWISLVCSQALANRRSRITTSGARRNAAAVCLVLSPAK